MPFLSFPGALPVSRLRWAFSHLLFAYGGPALILTVYGLATGVMFGLGSGNMGGDVSRILSRALVAVPAVRVMVSITVFLYVYLPRAAVWLSRTIFAILIVLEIGWEVRWIPQSVFNLSPFAHVHWTTSNIAPLPVALLTVVAVVFAGIGLSGLQRRDIG